MKLFSRPRHGTVVAYLALAVAISGTAYAAATIRSDDIVNGQVKTPDLDEGAVTKSKIDNAAVGTAAIENFGVSQKDLRRSAYNNSSLITFENGWSDYNEEEATPNALSFWKDANGVVHLEGAVEDGGVGTIFKLPAGYRPAKAYADFPVITASGEPGDFDATIGYIEVIGVGNGEESGAVKFYEGLTGYVALDGITFRAD